MGQLELFNPDNWSKPVEENFLENEEDIFSDHEPISSAALKSLHEFVKDDLPAGKQDVNLTTAKNIFRFYEKRKSS